jgi:hypothetical protein
MRYDKGIITKRTITVRDTNRRWRWQIMTNAVLRLGICSRPGLVGVRRILQYGPTAMQVNRRLSINTLFALALVLGSLWIGGLAAAAVGDVSEYLATEHAQQRMQSAVLPDLVVVLRPAPERFSSFGRLERLLLAVLVSAGAAGDRRRVAGPRPGLTRAGSRVCSTPLQARAPPCLQPA